MYLIIASSTKFGNIVKIKEIFAFIALNCGWFYIAIVAFYKNASF